MAPKKKKHEERQIFDSIRKPTAPPTRKMSSDAVKEKRMPSLRKTKHKKEVGREDK